MTFILKSTTLLSRIAKRLREMIPAHACAPLPEAFNFKDATAYTLGHQDLRALQATLQQAGAAASAWDEECTTLELESRRLHQATRLAEYAFSHGVQLEHVEDLVAHWQPTAARPQSPTISVDKISKLRDDGVPLQAYRRLLEYEQTGKDPTPEDLELFRNGIKSSTGMTGKLIPLSIGILAVRLVNRQTDSAARLGIALLEMLCETELIYAKVNLARALLNGWGVTPNLERAKALCTFVNKAVDAGEDVFTDDASRIDFYKLQGQLYSRSTLQEERVLAFANYRKAALLGSGTAALITSHYYAALPPGIEPDEFAGVVLPDHGASKSYFSLALQQGFNPDTNSFPNGEI